MKPRHLKTRTHSQVSTSSIYKGVSWDAAMGKWKAQIWVAGKPGDSRRTGSTRMLGRFASQEAAARAYDRGARELYGDRAALNFPLPGERPAAR